MSRRFRLVAVDADGTLVDGHDQIAPRVIKAIRAAVELGVDFVLATGRGPRMVRHLVAALEVPTGLVMGNGALLSEHLAVEPFELRLLSPDLAREAVQCYRDHGLEPIVFDHPLRSDRVGLERETELLAPFIAANEFRLNRVPDLMAFLDHPVLMLCSFAPEAKMREFAGQLTAALPDRVEVQPMLHPKYGLWVCDCFLAGCSKWSGLVAYASRKGIDPSEILAIGDGLNDLPMIVGAGWGVAMGNADPEVRAVADEVVGDLAHDGVAEAIERHILGVGAQEQES